MADVCGGGFQAPRFWRKVLPLVGVKGIRYADAILPATRTDTVIIYPHVPLSRPIIVFSLWL